MMKYLLNIFFACAILLIFLVLPAAARTINVTTFGDAYGIDGVCSLREAVLIANDDITIIDDACGGYGSPGADVISLPSGTYILFTDPATGGGDGRHGDLDISSEVTLLAPNGATIEAGQGETKNYGRVIDVRSGARVIIQNITIMGGAEDLTTGGPGGGILNNGWLVLENSAVTGNTSTNRGGGIFSGGSSELYLFDSTVSGNTDTGTIAGAGGGGIYAANGARVGLTRSTVSGNLAHGNGGGILALSATASGGRIELANSTISGNSAWISGGGVYHGGNSFVSLSNVTITGNTANSDVSSNNDGYGGGIVNAAGGIVNLWNTIIAGNASLLGSPGLLVRDCSGTFISQGYNLIQYLDIGCTLDDTAVPGTDQTGVDPLLGVLANNGGPTLTHALQAGSPAMDAGNPNGCSNAGGGILSTDQRSYIRPSGTRCDIGATEYQYPSSRYVVNSNADNGTGCTLREALQSVISDAPTGGCTDLGSTGVATIEFAPSVTGTITLTSDLPTVNKALHVVGPGSGTLGVSGAGSYRSGLSIDDPGNTSIVVVEGLAFTNGFTNIQGGAFIVARGETLELKNVLIDGNESPQSCVRVYGHAIISNSTISNCTGRGIVVSSGSLNIEDSTVSGNSSLMDGGGVYLWASPMTATDTTFSGNSSTGAGSAGGGLLIDSGNLAVSLERCTFSGNTAASGGAGIFLGAGTLSVLDTAITGNSAGIGGGIGVSGTQSFLTVANSTISGNTALSSGGGLHIYSAGSADLANVTITNNTADLDADGAGDGGGLAVVGSVPVTLRNSILSGNKDLSPGGGYPDCYSGAGIVSGGFNLIGSASGCSSAAWSADDIFGAELLLLPLADYGGPTKTHAVLPPSPAVDGADPNSGCFWDHDVDPATGDVELNTDQRARARYTDGDGDGYNVCDIGAFEFDPVTDAGLWATHSTLGITINGTGSGTVTSSPAGINCGTDCTNLYDPDTVVTLTPVAATGSYFAGWSGDADCSDGSVTMSANVSCTATFTEIQHTLTITLAGNGTGTVSSVPAGIACPGDCSQVYNYGTTVALTPAPDSGWMFIGWSGDEDCLDGSVTMNAARACTANFADAHRYTVTSNLDDGTGCTLREAIQSLMGGTPTGGCVPTGAIGTDTIDFAQTVTGTITLTSELPTVNKALRVVGPGSGLLAIDGGGSHRSGFIISSGANATVSIQGLTFSGGFATAGGALAVVNDNLELDSVVIAGNQAPQGGGISLQGGSLTIVNSTISGNAATSSFPNGGGGLYLINATASIVGSIFLDNTASGWAGGALLIRNANNEPVVIETTMFSGNSAKQSGAVEITGGSISVLGSTFHNNTATVWGGGAFTLNYNTDTVQSLTIANSTISGNTATGVGGGIYKNSGVVRLANVTVTDNTTNGTSGGGIYSGRGDGVVLRNSIVSGNNAPSPGAESPDVSCVEGTILSEDYNLIGVVGSCSGVTWGSGDVTGTNPLLGSIANNGGPTMTHGLLAGSPAIDGANPFNGCSWDHDSNSGTSDINLTTDQRGANRYADGNGDTFNVCDIGAYEYNPTGDADGDGILDDADRCIQNKPAMSGVTEYSTVQAAMNAAAVGDHVVKVQAGTFSQAVTVSQAGAVTVRGHYTCDFTELEISEKTTLGGPFTIGTGGPVTFDGFGL